MPGRTQHPGAKTLDDAQRRRLALVSRAGIPLRDLANRFNISVGTLKRVLTDIRKEERTA